MTPETAHRPQFALTSNNASLAGKPFVLVMFDPDAPTPKNRSLSQIRHLVASVQLASDISTTVLTSTAGAPLSNSTPAVWDYLSPGPPPGSDPHRSVTRIALLSPGTGATVKRLTRICTLRYTLLLFDQPATFAAAVPRFVNASSPITGFDVRAFAKALDLGAPIAGNFFLTGPVGGSNSSSTSTTKSGKSSARGSADVHVGAIAFGVSVAAAAFGSTLL